MIFGKKEADQSVKAFGKVLRLTKTANWSDKNRSCPHLPVLNPDGILCREIILGRITLLHKRKPTDCVGLSTIGAKAGSTTSYAGIRLKLADFDLPAERLCSIVFGSVPNLIRSVMQKVALTYDVDLRRISFKGSWTLSDTLPLPRTGYPTKRESDTGGHRLKLECLLLLFGVKFVSRISSFKV